MNNGDPVLIPIACRFVASDQWLTAQLDTSWKISEVKKYILTKVYNRSVADNDHESSQDRPVSPITFASARDSFDSTLIGSLEDDLNADLDHHFFTEPTRQPRVRHPPTQRVTSPSVPELPTEQPPAAAAASEAELGLPPRHYSMLAFSTGQLLEDDFSLAWYRLRPHELLELHPPGTIVRLPREVMLDYVKPYLELDVRALRVIVNNSDKDKDKDSHALGPSCAPPQLPPSSLPLPLDASSSSLSSPTKLRKPRDAVGESRGASVAAGAGGGVSGAGGGCSGSPAGTQSMRKRRKTKLEWRDRYLVVRQGMLSLFKSRTDLTPVHTCSLATLTTLRGQEEVVHTTTAAARSPHVVCAKFHIEASAPGSPDPQSSSLPMTEQWNDPWSGGTIAPAPETDGNLWRRPESKEDLKQRRSIVEGCERSRGNSIPKEDLLDSRTSDSKPESLRYDINVGDGTQGIWLVLDALNEFGYSNLLRVLHRSSPDTISSSLVPSYLLPDSSLSSPSSPSSQLSSYTGTLRGSTCPYPEWRIEVSRRAQKTGLGDVTDAMSWVLWGGPPLEPPTSKRSVTELRKEPSQLTTDDPGPHPEPFDLDVDDGGNDEDFELEWDSWAMDLMRQALTSASNNIAVTVTEPVPIHPHQRIRPIASSSTFSSVSLSDHGPSSSLGRRPSDILLGANMRLLSKDSPALLTAPSVLPFQSTGVTTSTVSVGNVVRTRSLISVDGGRGRGVPRAMEVLSEDISGSVSGGGGGGGSGSDGRSTGRSRSGRQKRKCEETLRGALASSAPSPSLAGPTANTITSTVTVHESGGTPSPTLPYPVSPFVEGSPRLAVSTSPPSSAAAALAAAAAAAGGGMSETASVTSGITTVTTTTTIQLLPRRPSASGDMLNEEAGSSSSQKRGDKVGKGKGKDKGKDKDKDKEKEKDPKSPSRRMAFSPERLVSKLDSALDFVTG